jgi:hypothetical protein
MRSAIEYKGLCRFDGLISGHSAIIPDQPCKAAELSSVQADLRFCIFALSIAIVVAIVPNRNSSSQETVINNDCSWPRTVAKTGPRLPHPWPIKSVGNDVLTIPQSFYQGRRENQG